MDAPSTASLAPNDTMRNGIATVKSELMHVHPLQPMQASVRRKPTPACQASSGNDIERFL
jgi:hypothetical protein